MTKNLVTIELHNQLNPKLWEPNGQLKKEVKMTLLKIAEAYYEFLNTPVEVLDLLITGSQANYNYSEYSDIDLHLVVDYGQVSCDQPVEDLFDTKRRLWKERHDINIHGVPVEVYVEDLAHPAVTSSYSLLKDQWINKPKPVEAHWDNDEISQETLEWLQEFSKAIRSQDLERIDDVKQRLKQYRQSGLDQEGEYGTNNLVFKNLRNLGAIGLLMKAAIKVQDRDLSI